MAKGIGPDASSEELWEEFWKSENKLLSFFRSSIFNRVVAADLRSYLKDGDNKILEVGCGNGSILDHLEKWTDSSIGVDVVTVPFSESNGVDFVKGDAFELPFKESSFDLVFSQGLLEHFKDPRPILRERIRVLKNRGYAVTFMPSENTASEFLLEKSKIPPLSYLWPWKDRHYLLSMKEFRRLLFKLFDDKKAIKIDENWAFSRLS
ncbi:MAG: class I SAM-dependent methyltransferase [Candidatus Aenigmatarchaeota archaeon]